MRTGWVALLINGSVVGSPEGRVTLNASKRVTIHNGEAPSMQFADIKSVEEIVVDGNVSCCTLSAKGKLLVHGKGEKSNMDSQTRIRLPDCGNGHGKQQSPFHETLEACPHPGG